MEGDPTEIIYSHRQRALQAFSTFLDAVQDTSRSIFERLEERIDAIESSSTREREESAIRLIDNEREREKTAGELEGIARERKETSERISQLEESIKTLQKANAARELEKEDRIRLGERFPNIILGESTRLREENAQLQDQVTRLQKENEDLRKRNENRQLGPAGERNSAEVRETAVGQRDTDGSTNPGKPQAIRLDTKTSSVPSDAKAGGVASYPTPRSPENPPVPPPGPKDGTAVKPSASLPPAIAVPLPQPVVHSQPPAIHAPNAGHQRVRPEGSLQEQERRVVQKGTARTDEELDPNDKSARGREGARGEQQRNLDVIDLTTDDEAPPRVARRSHVENTPDETAFFEGLAHNLFIPFQLPADVKNHHKTFRFSRLNLANICGGPPQGTFAPVGDRKEKHGYDRFMCQDRTHNPYAPSRPGAHGSHFACRDKKQWPRIDGATECLILKEGNSIWGVYGLYRCERSEPLTGEEFKRLPKKIQNHWIESAYKIKTSWSKHTLAAIYLRQSNGGEDPSDEDVEQCVNSHKSGGVNLFEEVTKEQVRHAFENGDERLNVFPMRCVGFDIKLVDVIHKGLYGLDIEEGVTIEEGTGEGRRKRKRSQSVDSNNLASKVKRRVPTRRAQTTANRDRSKNEPEDNDGDHISDSEEEDNNGAEDEGNESEYEPHNRTGLIAGSSSHPRRSTRRIS